MIVLGVAQCRSSGPVRVHGADVSVDDNPDPGQRRGIAGGYETLLPTGTGQEGALLTAGCRKTDNKSRSMERLMKRAEDHFSSGLGVRQEVGDGAFEHFGSQTHGLQKSRVSMDGQRDVFGVGTHLDGQTDFTQQFTAVGTHDGTN